MSARPNHRSPGTVFLETNWRFVKAVRVGETIIASVKVEHVRDDKPICRLETIVRNAAGETCVVGTASTYTMPLEPQQSPLTLRAGVPIPDKLGR